MFGRLFRLFAPTCGIRQVFGACVVFSLLLAPAWSCRAVAAGQTDSQSVPLVGIGSAPPFAMKDGDGNWQGIAVELWRHAARDLGLQFEFREMAIPDLVAGLKEGKLLAVVTAIASAEREKEVDLSHPYYSGGLAIAVPVRSTGGGWFDPLANLVSFGTLRITGVLFGLLLLAATLVWFFERRANPDHFDARPLRGIADGLWWAAVTLTTVGYGDKAPRTRAGRVVGVVWMLVAVVLIALFTAQVTSSLTVTSLTGRVRGPSDLPHVRVGALAGSQQQALLRSKLGVTAAGYAGLREGLEALDRGEIDAFVSVDAVLRYEIANAFPGRLTVVGVPFLRIDQVFAFPLNSPIRKAVNYSLLAYIESNEWRELLHQYLGEN